MDDLITFLNARFGELEASKDEIHHRDCDSRECRCYEAYPCNCGEPQRRVADIAAKRQIIEQCVQVRRIPNSGLASDVAKEAVRILAVPYASHPDYRAEWAPKYS